MRGKHSKLSKALCAAAANPTTSNAKYIAGEHSASLGSRWGPRAL